MWPKASNPLIAAAARRTFDGGAAISSVVFSRNVLVLATASNLKLQIEEGDWELECLEHVRGGSAVTSLGSVSQFE